MFIVFRLFIKLLTLGFSVWLFLCAALFAIMWLPPSVFARQIGRIPGPAMILMAVMPFETMWNAARGGALREADPAPDFDLQRQDKSGRVKLSSHFGDRPVVLVFGSYT
jgi:hypothetical protein